MKLTPAVIDFVVVPYIGTWIETFVEFFSTDDEQSYLI